MNNLKFKGRIILIVSLIVMIASVVFMIVTLKNGGESSGPAIYEVDNSFSVDSPLGFNSPYEVNVYGIVENKTDSLIEDVVVRVYYYDTDRKRHEVVIPSFDISANSEYTIDYYTTGEERAFYIDKVEYKIGNGSYKTLSGHFALSGVGSGLINFAKCIPFIILILLGAGGVFVGVAMVTFKKPTVNKFSDVFKPSVRKDVIKCKYCGTYNKNGELKCASCGASIEY